MGVSWRRNVRSGEDMDRIRSTMRLVLLALLAALLVACGGAAYESKSAGDAAMSPGSPSRSESVDADYGGDDQEMAEMEEGAVFGGVAATAAEPAPVAQSGGGGGAPAPPAPKPKVESRPDVPAEQPGAPPQVASPMLIYEATFHMGVFQTTEAIDRVEKLARDSGGYLVRRSDREITVRVPAGKFDSALKVVAELGDVLHRDVNVKDVTEEYFDLQVRLKNARAMRERLEELLKRANKVEDALAVEKELERIAGAIERYEGRMKLLRELVSFSTITVKFQAKGTESVNPEVRLPFPWLRTLGLGPLLRM